MNAQVARMDTDSDSESEDQYELEKLAGTMEVGGTIDVGAAGATGTSVIRRNGDLDEIEELLNKEEKKNQQDNVF